MANRQDAIIYKVTSNRKVARRAVVAMRLHRKQLTNKNSALHCYWLEHAKLWRRDKFQWLYCMKQASLCRIRDEVAKMERFSWLSSGGSYDELRELVK